MYGPADLYKEEELVVDWFDCNPYNLLEVLEPGTSQWYKYGAKTSSKISTGATAFFSYRDLLPLLYVLDKNKRPLFYFQGMVLDNLYSREMHTDRFKDEDEYIYNSMQKHYINNKPPNQRNAVTEFININMFRDSCTLTKLRVSSHLEKCTNWSCRLRHYNRYNTYFHRNDTVEEFSNGAWTTSSIKSRLVDGSLESLLGYVNIGLRRQDLQSSPFFQEGFAYSVLPTTPQNILNAFKRAFTDRLGIMYFHDKLNATIHNSVLTIKMPDLIIANDGPIEQGKVVITFARDAVEVFQKSFKTYDILKLLELDAQKYGIISTRSLFIQAKLVRVRNVINSYLRQKQKDNLPLTRIVVPFDDFSDNTAIIPVFQNIFDKHYIMAVRVDCRTETIKKIVNGNFRNLLNVKYVFSLATFQKPLKYTKIGQAVYEYVQPLYLADANYSKTDYLVV
jgi:hypothetical protein